MKLKDVRYFGKKKNNENILNVTLIKKRNL